MSAATKAKIAAAQKGNKNAYKGGKVKPGALGGKRDKKSGIKTIRNNGYGKRRAALNLAGAAAAGGLGLLAAKGVASKRARGGGAKASKHRKSIGIVGAASLGIGSAVARSHKVGMAKRSARKNGTVLVLRKRNGKVNAYHPVAKKKKSKKKK